jgi:seryl-tRNA synthetase
MSFTPIKFCIPLLVLSICLSYCPVSFAMDRAQEALYGARDELLKKQDELLKEEDHLKREINRLAVASKDNNDPAIYDELKDKTYRLNKVDSELDRTRDSLRDVERNLNR